MFTAYYDAAGGKDHGFIVVAGWVSDLEMWEKFAVDWRLALAQAHVPYFHMKAFSQSKLHFESWKDQEGKRRNFLHTLTSIIRSYVRYGVGTYVEYEAFEKANASYCLKEWVGNPYSLAGRDCAKESLKWILQQARLPIEAATPALPLRHVFEEGDEGQGLLEKLMRKDNYPDFRAKKRQSSHY